MIFTPREEVINVSRGSISRQRGNVEKFWKTLDGCYLRFMTRLHFVID